MKSGAAASPYLETARLRLERFQNDLEIFSRIDHFSRAHKYMWCLLNANKRKTAFGTETFELAHEAMHTIQHHGEVAGAKLFLVSGTLLGPYREGALLTHDYDLDFGVFSDDAALERFARQICSDPRFELQKKFSITNELAAYNEYFSGRAGAPLKYSLLYRGNVTIDVFVHIRHNGTIYHGTDRNIWLNSSFDLKPWKLNGISYLIPSEPECYLEENYGDWRLPVFDYHCATDTPNCGDICSHRALLHNFRLLLRFMRDGDDRRAGVIRTRIANAKCRGG